MADMIETLKNMLGDNPEEKINSLMKAMNSGKTESTHPTIDDTVQTNQDVNNDLLYQAQSLISQLSNAGNDTRSNLLMALKPYMRESRRNSIDNAVKLLNLAQLSQLFKEGF